MTKEDILIHTTRLFALYGEDGVSIRTLAEEVGVAPSVIYHHFKNKDELLRNMFDSLGTQLGRERALLPHTDTASDMLRQRIRFQLDHAQEITAVLKYFFAHRQEFDKNPQGYVPKTAYLHILEVLIRGQQEGEFTVFNPDKDAKVITHAINGFVLEYFPTIPTGQEQTELIDTIHQFLIRALIK